ncbi:hypothetical protein GQ53DRAFT_17057 [Thozetella sp. PMI_491]|nr:hypothetical protein GQ53DRAFT_17057 [Thozetella sp. PMI_491]
MSASAANISGNFEVLGHFALFFHLFAIYSSLNLSPRPPGLSVLSACRPAECLFLCRQGSRTDLPRARHKYLTTGSCVLPLANSRCLGGPDLRPMVPRAGWPVSSGPAGLTPERLMQGPCLKARYRTSPFGASSCRPADPACIVWWKGDDDGAQ